ncbi:MAG: carboxypeptidase regulatory-like domain-containing protein [Planctomycetes bacterium]|nr:carboxypeptidase regulatory-like domain-containing protein [Planctomycetota bacterium]
MNRSARAALTLLLLATKLGAQTDARDAAVGIVRDADGKPCAGATVEFAGRPWPEATAIGWSDVVRVTSDARGRFRAELRPGITYAAWAWIEDAGGARRSSAIVERIVPRTPVALALGEPAANRLARLELTAVADWPAPLAVELEATTDPRVTIALAPLPGDAFAVPPIPTTVLRVRVRAANGAVLVESTLDVGRLRGPTTTIDLPAAKRQRFAVRDVDTGKGVPGATLLQMAGGAAVPIGTTDADGCAELAAISSSEFRACGPGLALAGMQAAEHAGGEPDWKPLREGFTPEWAAHVGKGVELRGSVSFGDAPLSAVDLVLSEGALHYSQKNSRALVWGRRAIALDARGAFGVGSVLAEFPPDLVLVLGPAALEMLPKAWRAAWPLIVAPWVVEASATGVVELERFDVARCVPVRVQVRGADGAPALDAEIALVPNRNMFGRSELPALCVDRSGAGLLLVPPERAFALVARRGDEIAGGRLETLVRDGDAPVEIALTLRPPRTIRGTVLGPDGVPRDGMHLWMEPSATRGAIETPAEPVPVTPRAGGATFTEGLADWPSDTLQIATSRPTVRTDAKGAFVVSVPDLGIGWEIHVGDVSVDVGADDDPQPIEIRLSR